MHSTTTDSTLLVRAIVCAPALASLALVLGACQTAVPRHDAGVFAGAGGASANVVFSGPIVVAAALPPGPELTRNDHRIAVREPETAYDQQAYAAPAKANLFRPFYLRVRNYSNDEQIFFRSESRQGLDSRTTYWGY